MCFNTLVTAQHSLGDYLKLAVFSDTLVGTAYYNH
jgi:hypothetical protein